MLVQRARAVYTRSGTIGGRDLYEAGWPTLSNRAGGSTYQTVPATGAAGASGPSTASVDPGCA